MAAWKNPATLVLDANANILFGAMNKIFGPDLPQPTAAQTWASWRATGALAALLPAASFDTDIWT
jgi:hypothetical protein